VSETKGRRPRMEDIAREAKVNRITVSRALSRPELVAKDTLARIEEVVARLGYIPDQVARGMKAERSRIVSLAAPVQMSGVYGAISEMLTQTLYNDGLVVNHFPLTDEIDQREAAMRELAGWRPAVIVLMSSILTDAMGQTLRNAHAPVVELLSWDPDSLGTCVGYDNRLAARRLTEHLVERGRRRIAYVHSANPLNALNETRFRGFTDCIDDTAGAAGTEWRVQPGYAEGVRLIDDMFAGGTQPEAILCGSDMVAVGALQACLARGISVPDDLAICAFDGTELTAVTHPAITSLDYPLERVADVGASEIQRLADKPDDPIRRVKIEARVQQRATT